MFFLNTCTAGIDTFVSLVIVLVGYNFECDKFSFQFRGLVTHGLLFIMIRINLTGEKDVKLCLFEFPINM